MTQSDGEIVFRYVYISTLKPAEYNPRSHDEQWQRKLESIGTLTQVSGDMINVGSISVDRDAAVNVAARSPSENDAHTPWYKTWWMFYVVYPMLVAVVAGLILARFTHSFGASSVI